MAKDRRSIVCSIREPASARAHSCTSTPMRPTGSGILPESLRLDRVRKTLGPAPPWFTRLQVEGKAPFHLGVQIASAKDREWPRRSSTRG